MVQGRASTHLGASKSITNCSIHYAYAALAKTVAIRILKSGIAPSPAAALSRAPNTRQKHSVALQSFVTVDYSAAQL